MEKKSKDLPSDEPYFSIVNGPEIQIQADTMKFRTLICNEVCEVTLLCVGRNSSVEGVGRDGLVLTKNDRGSFSRVASCSWFIIGWDGSRIACEIVFEESDHHRLGGSLHSFGGMAADVCMEGTEYYRLPSQWLMIYRMFYKEPEADSEIWSNLQR